MNHLKKSDVGMLFLKLKQRKVLLPQTVLSVVFT